VFLAPAGDEPLAVMTGAIAAAVVFSQIPALRNWVANRMPWR
jgi:hypothetical protein